MAKYGIDISTWQPNYPYYRAKQAGVEFAIIRAGYARTKDNQFENHYANLKALGMGVGAYWYSYAYSAEQARQEALTFLQILSGKQFDYPVYLDLEDPSQRGLGRSVLDSIVEAFCSTVEKAGYYVGVYSNVDWYNNVISGCTLNQKYDFWIASWGTKKPSGINAGMWQFGGSVNLIKSPQIAGVTTDQNYAYLDYPSIIKSKGLNGYGKGAVATKPQTTPINPTVSHSPSLIKAGDTVQVVNPVTYTGQPFTAYYSTYDVIEVKGERVVIGRGRVVTAAVHAGNLAKIGAPSSSGQLRVGDKVKVLQGIQYSGQPFTVYYSDYDVIEISGSRVVIGKGKVVTAAVNIRNLQKLS